MWLNSGLPARTVQRDIWTVKGDNAPVAMNETLTSGMSVFADVAVGAQDTDAVFAQFLSGFACLQKGVDADFLRVCNNYNAR